MERKPFAISSYTNNQYIVVCDDGTIWRFSVQTDGASWNSCRASRNHPPNPRVPDSDDVLLQNSLRSIGRSCRSILCSKAATEKPFALRRGEYEPGPIVAGYRDLAVASSNQSATER